MAALPNPRHERFAQELAEGKNATEAYEVAGYKRNAGNAATLKSDQNISKRVVELQEQRAGMAVKATEKAVEKLALTKEWVIGRLMENAERALTTQPVLDKDGQPTGSYTYDGAVANRALELLGKHLGILIERREIGEPGEFDRLADEEVMAEMRKEAAELGLSSGKTNGRGNGTSH